LIDNQKLIEFLLNISKIKAGKNDFKAKYKSLKMNLFISKS